MTISSALPAKRDSKKLPIRIMLYQSDLSGGDDGSDQTWRGCR